LIYFSRQGRRLYTRNIVDLWTLRGFYVGPPLDPSAEGCLVKGSSIEPTRVALFNLLNGACYEGHLGQPREAKENKKISIKGIASDGSKLFLTTDVKLPYLTSGLRHFSPGLF
jgi:hypothetical protein